MSSRLFSFRSCLRVATALFLSAFTTAAFAGSVEIRVTDTQGNPLPGATVSLIGTHRETTTGADGAGRFENVPAGSYDVMARLSGFAAARSHVNLTDDVTASVDFRLVAPLHFSEAVTVSPGGRDTFESYQPATVLGGEDLQQRVGATLGATLANEPGVNVRSFGTGNERPVIRGLDGDRVLILENGARTGDLSSQSADHGVTLDPSSATQLEVVRGPATLLYGSSAIGGVINLVSDEIPTKPVEGVHGALMGQGATANDEGAVGGHLRGGNGHVAFRANGSYHRTADYDTPSGLVPNSFSRSKSGGGSLAYTGENGFAGASYQYVNTRYGVPFVEEGKTTLNPRRHRFDFRAERRNLGSFIDGVKFQAGYRDYAHDEIEASGEIATSFKNEFTEGQLLLNHRPVGRLKGTFGFWGTHRDYSSAGAEALAPPTKQNTFAAFLYEELSYRHLSVQFGGRLDRSSFETNGASVERPDLPNRDFTEFSGSVGFVGHLRDELTLALNLARSPRNPSLEELYNFGPHPGNFAFEIGNPNLKTEVGYGADLSLRYRSARFAGEGTLFLNSVNNYIFAFQTGELDEGGEFPVVSFISADSQLRGFEAHVDAGLTEKVWLILGGDAVRGELRADSTPLPRIPPRRLWAGLRFQDDQFHLEGEVKNVAKQSRVYGAEIPTSGYTVVNFHGSYEFNAGKTVHIVTLRLDNVGDELYRNHLSYIKDLVPEMGRSLKAVYSVRF
jgi:iron complex outermembrane receptor protein